MDNDNLLDANLLGQDLTAVLSMPLTTINNQLSLFNTYYDQLNKAADIKIEKLQDSLFIPRLSAQDSKLSNGLHVYDSPFWRQSPFSGKFYLPNCTCYAWGRYAEVAAQGDLNKLNEGLKHARRLPTGDGGTWVRNAPTSLKRSVENSQTDQDKRKYLGAVIEWTGQVAIVEKIEEIFY